MEHAGLENQTAEGHEADKSSVGATSSCGSHPPPAGPASPALLPLRHLVACHFFRWHPPTAQASAKRLLAQYGEKETAELLLQLQQQQQQGACEEGGEEGRGVAALLRAICLSEYLQQHHHHKRQHHLHPRLPFPLRVREDSSSGAWCRMATAAGWVDEEECPLVLAESLVGSGGGMVLRLQRLEEEDVDVCCGLLQLGPVMQYMDHAPLDREAAYQYVHDLLAAMSSFPCRMFTMTATITTTATTTTTTPGRQEGGGGGEVVVVVVAAGLVTIRLDGDGVAVIGYMLHPEFWGRGVGSELVRLSSHEVALGLLGARTVRAEVDVHNKASIRVLEKNGYAVMSVEEAPPGRDTVEVVWMHITRETAAAAAEAARRRRVGGTPQSLQQETPLSPRAATLPSSSSSVVTSSPQPQQQKQSSPPPPSSSSSSLKLPPITTSTTTATTRRRQRAMTAVAA